jgi:hypothetical protein
MASCGGLATRLPAFCALLVQADYQSAAGCHPVVMSLRLTKGYETRVLREFVEEAREGWPGGQTRTRGSALLRLVFDPAPQKTVAAREEMNGL